MRNRNQKEKATEAEYDSKLLRHNADLGKYKKRATDFRQFLRLVSTFKILQPLKVKPLSVVKSWVSEITKISLLPGQLIQVDQRQVTVQNTWLVLEGTLRLIKQSQDVVNIEQQSVYLSEGTCFGSRQFAFRECLDQPESFAQFSAVAQSECVLIGIPNSRMNRVYDGDLIQQELQKRTLICKALNLHTSGHTIKSFVRKFVLNKHSKSTLLVQQGQKQDTFIVVSKGDVEILKECVTDTGERIKASIGIVSEENFINDNSFFCQQETGLSEYTLQAKTEIQVYVLGKAELFKYFYDLPTLWPNISSICEQKQTSRLESVTKHKQKRGLVPIEQPHGDVPFPSFRKTPSGIRNQIQSVNQDFTMQHLQYEQLVINKKKIAMPLMSKVMSARGKTHQLEIGQLKKVVKKQKMDIMKVKNLVYNRIRGIKSSQFAVELKPTLFNDRSNLENIQDLETRTLNTTCIATQPVLRCQRKIMSVRNLNSQSLQQSTPIFKSLILKVSFGVQKPFKMVSPPRQHFESRINKSTDAYIYTRCQTGKPRKVRVPF